MPAGFFVEIDKIIIKFIGRFKVTRISKKYKQTCGRGKKIGRLTVRGHMYYKAAWSGQSDISIKSTEVDPNIWSQLIFDVSAKVIQ